MIGEPLGGTWTINLPMASATKRDGVEQHAMYGALVRAQNNLERELAKLAGGFTRVAGHGAWAGDATGRIIEEPVWVYKVSGNIASEAMTRLARDTAELGAQDAVYVVDPDNKGWLVRPRPATATPIRPREFVT